MLASLALSAILAASPSGKTLWLVEPLYPGQEQLLGRSEQAVRQLIRPEERGDQVVGKAELVAFLKAQPQTTTQGVLGCIASGTCKDPLDLLLKNLGFARVHLLKSGQDESGYRVRLATYRPAEGIVGTTEGSAATLDKALLGAVVKVDQLISTLDVQTTPPGAAVIVDNEKIGVTPLTTQVLPGERSLKLVLPGYAPVEITQTVPVRGVVKVERTLEKVPARLVANVKPEGTDVAMDGKVLGKDHLDLGIQPGAHAFKVSHDGYHPFETKAEIQPGETYHLDQELKPTAWESFRQMAWRDQDDIYSRHMYFDVNFELLNLNGDRISGRRFGDGTDKDATLSQLLSPGPSAALYGVSAEYGSFGKYFGLMYFGLGYSRNAEPWRVQVLNPTPGSEQIDVHGDFLHLRLMQPQVRYALWRLVLTAQLGLELWGGLVQETGSPVYAGSLSGFGTLNLLASGRLMAKVFIVAGFYLQAAYRYTFTIYGFRSSANEPASALRGWSFGLGYAF